MIQQMELKIALHGEGTEYYWEQVRGASPRDSPQQTAEFGIDDVNIQVNRCDLDHPDVELRVVIFDVTDESSLRVVDEVKATYVDCDVTAVAWHESTTESSDRGVRWLIVPCTFAKGRDAIAMHWSEDSWKPLITKLQTKYPALWSVEITEAVLEYLDHMYWG